MIAIKNNFFKKILLGVYIYNLSTKKVCIYNKKASMYMCVCGDCLIKYISVAT